MPHLHPPPASSISRRASIRTAKSVLVIALAGLIVGVALTTTPAGDARAQAPTAAQAASVDTSPDALLVAAGRVLALLDTGNYAPLWQDIPPVLQSRFKQDTFIADMKSARQSVGPLRQRTWSGVSRLRYATPTTPQGVPAGLYANVEMSSTTTDGRSLIERISFRLENDGSVRFTGYLPRPLGAAGTASGAPQ